MKYSALGMFLFLSLTMVAFAQDSGETPDEAAVRATVEKYVDAFNAGDVDALISVWADDGDYVDQFGTMIQGKENIAREYRKYFARTENPTLKVDILSMKMLGDSVATEDGIREADIGPTGEPLRVRYTAIHVKKDGKWLVQSIRDSIATTPSNFKYLRDLSWMIGEWVDTEEDGTLIHTSCDWSKDKNFLIRNLSSMYQGKTTMTALQMIGWDAVNGQIKSWQFDSNGAIGVGTWSFDGQKWLVNSETSLPTGQVIKETHVISKGENDTMVFESKDRTIDGEEIPDVREVTSVRAEMEPQPESGNQ
ncbi:MAG: nuclear transport factor 2 family protein [Candidatus Omnitrophica bacterium]|nr:nuclear transport factor 2 family protein [Candidatus Omnitrophota bacterium]